MTQPFVYSFLRTPTERFVHLESGKEFPHRFDLEGVTFWADDTAIDTGFALVVGSDPQKFVRLDVRAKKIDGASMIGNRGKDRKDLDAHVNTGGMTGTCISPSEDEIAPGSAAELKRHLDAEVDRKNAEDAGARSGFELAPVRPEDLAELFTLEPDALNPEKIDAPTVNEAIKFWSPGTEPEGGGAMVLHPLRGIVLVRFEVPADFGSPSDDETESGIVRVRHAYYVLTTAPGVYATDRDKIPLYLPAGSVVWVDEKHDLKPMVRYLPTIAEDGTPLSATEIFVQPLKKAKYMAPGKGGKMEPRYSWRMPLKFLRRITNPEHLRKIAAMAMQCPPIPTSEEPPPVQASATIGDVAVSMFEGKSYAFVKCNLPVRLPDGRFVAQFNGVIGGLVTGEPPSQFVPARAI